MYIILGGLRFGYFILGINACANYRSLTTFVAMKLIFFKPEVIPPEVFCEGSYPYKIILNTNKVIGSHGRMDSNVVALNEAMKMFDTSS